MQCQSAIFICSPYLQLKEKKTSNHSNEPSSRPCSAYSVVGIIIQCSKWLKCALIKCENQTKTYRIEIEWKRFVQRLAFTSEREEKTPSFLWSFGSMLLVACCLFEADFATTEAVSSFVHRSKAKRIISKFEMWKNVVRQWYSFVKQKCLGLILWWFSNGNRLRSVHSMDKHAWAAR